MTQRAPLLIQLQDPAGVWIPVGVLRSRDNTNWFATFSDYWISDARPVLGQVFEQNPRTWSPSAHVAIPHWFSHLLPEGRLREAVAAAASMSPRTEFDLLRLLGSDDLPGATRAIAWDEDSPPDAPAVVDDEDHSSDDPLLKFSLAGFQMKFSVRESDRGLTVPIHGQAGNLILKLPDARPGFEFVPEAEHASMQFAAKVGIRAAETRLASASEVAGLGEWAGHSSGQSLLVSRFDRKPDGARVHAEEFAQVLGISANRPNAKYSYTNFEAIANIAANYSGTDSVGEVIDRIVFNILIGNGDAHLKNWGLIYADGRNSRLGPAYDLVPTALYVKNDDLGLNLNGSKSFSDVTSSSFDRIGEITGYGVTEARSRAQRMTQSVLDNWSVFEDLLTKEHAARLRVRLDELALSRS
jgi:serine/threonine-protein kinase HipA